ncbi:glycosyltransferase [Metabacillus malikii]|uniref:Sterol 3beta-glucosyltransferase n=1 Tax=Metabacillus malikii TaxID=1504265 RepID=A0ABT9ZD58_9BACI|nr:glycosyltransferase [Metabacillus malikii]MDQ0230191.1 sterol 3beta-glucosyltransferase [Metabacillus malikii]
MKVTILTLGSRGDVQPYVALAKELLKHGHDVLICTGLTFKQFIEEHGISFHEANADLMAIMESEEGRAVFNGGNLRIGRIIKFTRTVVTPAYRKSMDDFYEASIGADLIIYHPKALGAVDIAIHSSIPCICLPPVPIMYPITEFPNFTISPNKSFGPIINRLSYKVVKLSESPFIKQINDFREKTLKLPKRKAGIYTFEANHAPIPILYPISPYLFQEVTSWNDRVFLSGFFFLDIEEETLSDEVEQFLQKGKKPIVVSFSSMPLKAPEVFKQKLISALIETENRAIVLTGTSGMNFTQEEHILAIEKAPHRLLFPRAKGVIHHGGVGTMSEALLSGVPQLIIPFTVDQPFWAHRLFKQGYSLKPLREKNLKVSDLIHSLNEIESKRTIDNAEKIKNIILAENGVQHAIQFIEGLIKQS